MDRMVASEAADVGSIPTDPTTYENAQIVAVVLTPLLNAPAKIGRSAPHFPSFRERRTATAKSPALYGFGRKLGLAPSAPSYCATSRV